MPINTQHPSNEESFKKIGRVRDFAAGEYVVKAEGKTYLPELAGQTTAEYNAYNQRGFLIPAVEPTKKAIVGCIMRRPAIITGAAEMLEFDADGNGTDLDQLVSKMISEILLAGGGGYLVEVDKIKTYPKESIVNWGADFVVLSQEYSEPSKDDKYVIEAKIELLELTYDENGNYIQNIWRENGKKWVIVETITPTRRGDSLGGIPFVHVGKNTDPVLMHLASVNLDQYRMSTDHRHGLHWTALPTLFLFGQFTDQDGNPKKMTIGAGSFNQIDDTDGRAELLEFTGAGLGSLKAAIDDNIKTMASIGAVMLTNGESGGVKAAETTRIEASSETATLSDIANIVDNTMQQILEIIDEWTGRTGSTYHVNRDFIDVQLDPAALTALLQTWQSGGMSLASFLYQLERGELLPPDISAEEEQGRIAQDPKPFDLEPDNTGFGNANE